MQSGLADKLEESELLPGRLCLLVASQLVPKLQKLWQLLGRRPINIVQDDEEEIGPPDPGLQAEDDSLS